MKILTPWLLTAGLVVLIVALAHSGGSSDSSAAAAPAAAAHVTMLRDRTTDNSCQEVDGDARIYVVITLRNSGDADATVNPWATFDYSDGGHSTESYFSNYGHDLNVPAHTDVDASFYHTFNPYQHSMLRCAGYADLGDSSDTGYYLPVS
jgi:hypothetical protein